MDANEKSTGDVEIYVTPAMVDAGLSVLESWGITQDRSEVDRELVIEAFVAMPRLYLEEKY